MSPVRESLSTFEERSPLYGDVRFLLNPGFIPSTLEVQGLRIGIRTLNSDDIFLIEARSGGKMESWYDWFLATSIWLFDDQILERDQSASKYLYREIKKIPKSIRSMLTLANTQLTTKYIKARDRALSYFYESESRELWGGRGSKLFEHSFSWVGRNSIQDLWAYYNKMEDMRQQRLFDQGMFAFSASPHAPKSIKKINNKMKSDEEILEIERSIVRDRTYFLAFGIEFEDNRFLQKNFGQIEVAMTFEDLEAQYKNYLEGNQDIHDIAVEKARERMIARRRAQRILREKKRQELLEKRKALLPALESDQARMFYGEEAERYYQEMQTFAHENRLSKFSEPTSDEGSFKKHIESEIQKPLHEGSPLSLKQQEELLKMTMMKSPKRDLTEEIKKRGRNG